VSGDVLVACHAALGAPGEALAAARALADAAGTRVAAVALGNVDPLALIAQGADVVHALAHAALEQAHVEAMTDGLAQVCAKVRPATVLMAHNAIGSDLAPRLAFRLDGNVATGCVSVIHDAGVAAYTRPRQGGIAREVLSYSEGLVVATLRAGHVEALAPDTGRCGEVIPVAFDPGALKTRLVERSREADEGGPRLEQAKVIVAGGRGLDGPEGFHVLETLARALGGVVGASRVPCDLGWCPRSWQIGLTGKTVLPDLYIAVGISGASHHMAGCGNAKTIVAINTDREAAIFKEARYGVVGDYRQIVPALTAALAA
jgi:electron transfer flavoprotein alpha subunit